ncbi:MAG: T9SS type A sorting domain-containing protein, partial [Saprospiraceae bacterium]|nr:T9SS type A sorting domain-containing protein [Saprospiraceae bacterium]
ILLSQNPVRDELKLLGNPQIEHLQILNVHGVRVYSGDHHNLLDVSHLPKGVYFLQVFVKNDWQQVSFVKS